MVVGGLVERVIVDIRETTELGQIDSLGVVVVTRASDGALVSLALGPRAERLAALVEHGGPLGADIREAMARYERRERDAFAGLRLEPARTPFAAKVREALRAIPWGQVKTYGQVAREVGSPGAARAVGMACHVNPLPLIVPCHRVVSASGWGGYALGLTWKQRLLSFEGFGTLPTD